MYPCTVVIYTHTFSYIYMYLSYIYTCTLVIYPCTLVIYTCTLIIYTCTLITYTCTLVIYSYTLVLYIHVLWLYIHVHINACFGSFCVLIMVTTFYEQNLFAYAYMPNFSWYPELLHKLWNSSRHLHSIWGCGNWNFLFSKSVVTPVISVLHGSSVAGYMSYN